MTYLIKICTDDGTTKNIHQSGDEDSLFSLAKNYLIANDDASVEIYDGNTNDLLHRYVMDVGTHNELKMYDLL